MDSITKENSVLSTENIIKDEPRFIDIYLDPNYKKRPMRRLFAFFKGSYKDVVSACIFFLIKVSPQWALPLITADIIDAVSLGADNAFRHIIIDLSVAFVLLIMNVPMNTLYIKHLCRATRRVEAGLRGAMIMKLQSLSITFHKEMASGKVQSKIMRDVEAITGFSHSLIDSVLAIAVNLAVTLTVVITKSIWVFLLFLVSVPIAVIIRRIFRTKMQNENREYRKEVERASANVLDIPKHSNPNQILEQKFFAVLR